MRKLHLVTGGCGFVGRHLLHQLMGQGADVWIVDDLSTGKDPCEFLPATFYEQPHSAAGSGSTGAKLRRFCNKEGQTITFEQGDLLASLLGQLDVATRRATGTWPPFDDAFHLASIVGGRHKIEGDPLHVGVDLAIDALFFRWLTAGPKRAQRVLYASSSAAYPVHLQAEEGHVALCESMLDMGKGELGQPDMTYGYSKMTGEYLAHVAASHYGLHVACVRPFSGYGEDQEGVYPVPAIAARVAAGEAPLTVWGTGEQGRDFVHIDDCIAAMLAAIERVSDGSAVNIGTGKLTTFLQLAALMLRLDGRPDAEIRPLAGKPVGVASRYCDPNHMHHVLGLRAQVSLEEGMGRVLAAAKAKQQRLPATPAPTPPQARAPRPHKPPSAGSQPARSAP